MSKFWSPVLLLGSLAVILAFQNCGGQVQNTLHGTATSSGTPVNMTATVMQAQTECAQLLLCSHDNLTNQDTCFLPLNIDQNILNAGNVINVSGTVRTDLENICLAQTLQVEQASLVSGSTTPATN